MIKLFNALAGQYRRVISSIGFWPTFITAAMGGAAMVLIAADTNWITTFLLENTPALVIKDGDTARVILSTVVGGLVSLTVFSFTMVMAQLNRAATSYSPRLLPGLISTKSHQFVLGVFLGTITFCLFVLITIEPSDDSYELPGLAILAAVVLSIACLGIFVFFIHSISQSIQISNILNRVAKTTSVRLGRLEEDDERQKHQEKVDVELSHTLNSEMAGYFHGCNESALVTLATKHDLVLKVIPEKGTFVMEKTKVIALSKEVEEEVQSEMLSCLQCSGSSLISENYTLGFKQIAEIAVRAMSPGTNDPGTALTAIDHLSDLFARRLRIDDREILSDDDGNTRVIISVISFKELLYLLHAPLRQYCKHDVVIVLKLLQMFSHLKAQPIESDNHSEAIEAEISNLISDAKSAIKNTRDIERICAFAATLSPVDDQPEENSKSEGA